MLGVERRSRYVRPKRGKKQFLTLGLGIMAIESGVPSGWDKSVCSEGQDNWRGRPLIWSSWLDGHLQSTNPMRRLRFHTSTVLDGGES